MRRRFHVVNRKLHAWGAVLLGTPLLVIAASGILLQLKKQVPWVQPAEMRGAGGEPTISFARVLEACRTVPAAQVSSWRDVRRIDVRPDRGMLKVWAQNGWEVQIDTATGVVLQAAYRRSDLIEAIHDGSWFHPWIKYGLFLPAGLTLLGLWITGWYMFLLPYRVRRRIRRAEAKRRN